MRNNGIHTRLEKLEEIALFDELTALDDQPAEQGGPYRLDARTIARLNRWRRSNKLADELLTELEEAGEVPW